MHPRQLHLKDDQQRGAGLPQEFLKDLSDFVQKGNGLIIFGGEHVAAEPYNRVLGKLGLLPAPLLTTVEFNDDRRKAEAKLVGYDRTDRKIRVDGKPLRIGGEDLLYSESGRRLLLGGRLPVLGSKELTYNQNVLKLGGRPVIDANDRLLKVDAPAIKFDRKTATAPAFLRFNQQKFYETLDGVKVWRTLEVQEPTKKPQGKDAAGHAPEVGQVLMRYTNGSPAIVGRKLGAGDVLFIATSADPGTDPASNEPTWNELSFWPGWLPFVQSCLTHMLERQTQKHNYTAGETIRWKPDADDADAPFVLKTPKLSTGAAGPKERLGRPRTEDGQPLLVTPVLDRAGLYLLGRADRENEEDRIGAAGAARGRARTAWVPFAVVADPREAANLETLSDQELDATLGFRRGTSAPATPRAVRCAWTRPARSGRCGCWRWCCC